MNQLSKSKENRRGKLLFHHTIFRHLIGWFRRHPKYAAGADRSKDTDRYDGYLSLKLQHCGYVWFKARGCSMLPVFAPLEQLKVLPLPDTLALGQVVVFNQGAKLTAHRIVESRGEGLGWIAKGDTLAFFDEPLSDTNILGVVETVQGWRGHRVLEPDVSTARLSSNLTRKLCSHGKQRPSLFKTCLFLVVFWTLYPFRRCSTTQKILMVSDKELPIINDSTVSNFKR